MNLRLGFFFKIDFENVIPAMQLLNDALNLFLRILETSQRPLHLIAQPLNSSQTSLMLTATWLIACRFE